MEIDSKQYSNMSKRTTAEVLSYTSKVDGLEVTGVKTAMLDRFLYHTSTVENLAADVRAQNMNAKGANNTGIPFTKEAYTVEQLNMDMAARTDGEVLEDVEERPMVL